MLYLARRSEFLNLRGSRIKFWFKPNVFACLILEKSCKRIVSIWLSYTLAISPYNHLETFPWRNQLEETQLSWNSCNNYLHSRNVSIAYFWHHYYHSWIPLLQTHFSFPQRLCSRLEKHIASHMFQWIRENFYESFESQTFFGAKTLTAPYERMFDFKWEQ